MKLAFLELKNPITSPTSSGFPIRPNALRSMRLLTRPRISLFPALEAVSINAGQTALTRIPLGPCSKAVVYIVLNPTASSTRGFYTRGGIQRTSTLRKPDDGMF